MGVVSEVLGNYGAPHQVQYNGKTVTLSLIDGEVESAFEKARFLKARAALDLVKDVLPPGEYDRRLQEKIDLYEAGEYEIFSESSAEFMRTRTGMMLILSLITGCGRNELLGLVTAKGAEIVPMLSLIMRESFPGMKMELSEAQPSTSTLPPPDKVETPVTPAAVPNG